MTARFLYSTACILLVLVSYSQCPPGPLGTGFFLDKPAGCATFGLDVNFTPQYSQLEDNSDIFIDWGDGNNQTIPAGTSGGQTGVTFNTPIPHTYTEAETFGGCVYTITAYVIGPNNCYTQEETTVTTDIIIWNTDNFGDGGGGITPTPVAYSVCAGTTATIDFDDLSPWNCTDVGVTANVNNQPRWTQWIYGITNTITGDPVTVGGADVTPGIPINGTVYNHTTLPVLDPQAPGNESLDVFIPSTAQVGDQFSVRLANWNQCNPYPANDSVWADAIITVVAPPEPDFEDLDGPMGSTLVEYCIGDDIYFNNLTGNTTGNTQYIWEFYDVPDTTGQTPIQTFNSEDATYAFANSGVKAVVLTATDPDVDAACDTTILKQVTISLDAIADFDFEDATFTSTINPDFCQNGSDVYTVGFTDNTTLLANTEVLYEFYQQGNPADGGSPDFTVPPLGAYSSTNIAPFVIDTFANEQYTVVKFIARNSVTGCQTTEQDTIFVYSTPNVDFMADEACEGNATVFNMIADPTGSLNPRINNDFVDTYEWDFSYDSVTFNAEDTRSDNSDFNMTLGTADTYSVALIMTTSLGGCLDTLIKEVTVNPLPVSSFTDSFVSQICPGESIDFTNTSVNPGLTVFYDLEISHVPSSFSDEVIDIGAGTSYTFQNDDPTVRTYDILLEATTDAGCETNSSVSNVVVNSDENSGFDDPTFSFIDPNCSPYSSTLFVDANTQSLNVEQYNWDIIDGNDQSVTGFPVTKISTDPDFHELDYQVSNDSTVVQYYKIVLEAIKTGVCIANDTFDILVSPPPDPTYNVVQQDNCEDVNFTVVAEQQGLSYDWVFNPPPDVLIDNEDEQLLTYNREPDTGADINLDMTLTVTNLATCSSDPEIQNFLIEKRNVDLVADFLFSTDTLIYPDTVFSITNLSTNGVNYLWDFGNGETSTDQGPFPYSYGTPGNYLVSLTVTDDYCEASTSDPFVLLPALPVIDFEADTIEGCAPLAINFSNLSTGAEAGQYFWQFGDGNFSLEDEPSYTYTSEGFYTVTLQGENSIGEIQEEQKIAYINVFGVPSGDFVVNQVDDCEEVLFSVQAGTPGLTYTWSFDPAPDSLMDDDDSQTLIYQREQNTGSDISVEISLMTKSADSCESSTVIQNFVVEKRSEDIVSDFTLSTDTLKVPDNTVTFTNLSTDGVNYLWNFGDGDISTEQGPLDHEFTDPGNYQVTLRVSDDYCEVEKTESFVLLPEDPIIEFEADVLEGCTPLMVNFTNMSQFVESGDYIWEFGDGNLSREDEPSHTYLAEGLYTVRLRGFNSVGVTGENEKIAYINVIGTPDSEFLVDKMDNCEDVNFFIQAEQEGLSYDWSFNPAPDIVEEDEDQVTLTYDRPVNSGSDVAIEISLIASAGGNCIGDEVTYQDNVEKRNPDLVADFAISKDTLKLPDSTIFITNLSTQNVNYFWDFGNGDSDTIAGAFNYPYTTYGNYQIFLTVTDDYCQAAAVKPFVLLPRDPIIDFEADTLGGCSPLTVAFTNLSQFAEEGKYVWDFGDGNISRAEQPIHTFFTGGDFTVRLRGENVAGVRVEEEKVDYISVAGSPFADFAASPRIVYIPDQQVFFKNLSENAVSYLWDFGDGETSTEMEPRHQYSNEGFYDITLVVENSLGCKDSLFRQTEIEAIIGGEVNSPNAFTPNSLGPTGGEVGPGGNLIEGQLNDVFLPKLEGVVQFKMQIFNKWGQMIFQSKSQNKGWDGYFNGKLAPAGVYIYKLEVSYSDGTSAVKVGDLTLVR